MAVETLVGIVDTGLTESEVESQQQQEGYNELSSGKSRSLLAIAGDTVRDPIFILLLGGGVIYWILGDLQEAMILLGFVVFIAGISLYQEGKTERALAALRDLSSPRALVIREGQRKRIAGREVVRGDLLVLAEGDRVPADAIVLSCTNLSTDESLLTGESLPVRKVAAIAECYTAGIRVVMITGDYPETAQSIFLIISAKPCPICWQFTFRWRSLSPGELRGCL
nr:cation-transporting P-type ATPase [Chamaesiphon sp. OTE_75_metabat_556]